MQGVLSVVPFQGGLVATYKACSATVESFWGLVATYVACCARSAKCSAF